MEKQDALEDLKNKPEELFQGARETAVERSIDLLIEGLTRWDDSGLWKSAYGTFFAPQIKIFAKLLLSELKYNDLYRFEINFMHAVDDYTDDMVRIRKRLPRVPASVMTHQKSYKLMEILDGWIGGTKSVIKGCARQTSRVNEFLSVDRPNNIFEYVPGKGSVSTARNDLCYAVLNLVRECELLIRYRNEWARVLQLPPVWPSLRSEMLVQCPNTPY
jgi:hypothetical protein